MEPTATPIGVGLLGVRVDKLDADRPESLKPGMSSYLLPFEIVSVHLLVVIVGALTWLARSVVGTPRKSNRKPSQGLSWI